MDCDDNSSNTSNTQHGSGYQKDPHQLSGSVPGSTQSNQSIKPCVITQVSQCLERTVFYAVVGNLAYFLHGKPLCWDEAVLSYFPAIITAMSLVVDLIFGMLLNCLCHRRLVIAGAYIIYTAGLAWLLVVTHDLQYTEAHNETCFAIKTWKDDFIGQEFPQSCRWSSAADWAISGGQVCGATLMICLLIIGSAAGIVHAGILTTASIQAGEMFCENWFFLLYYVVNNIGVLLACLPLAYLQQHNYFCSFTVSAFLLVMSAAFFIIGQYTEPYLLSNVNNEPDTGQQGRQDPWSSRVRSKIIDWKKHVLSLNGKTRAVYLLLLLSYQVAYGSVYPNFYLIQGLHTDVDLDRDKDLNCWKNTTKEKLIPVCDTNGTLEINLNPPRLKSKMVPPASLMASNAIAVIVCIIIFGFLQKCNSIPSEITRLVLGQIALALSLGAAAMVEYYRLEMLQSCGYFLQDLGNFEYYASPLSVYWQIPQYVLLGISEVLVLVTGLQFVYVNAKEDSLRGINIRIFWFVAGCGRFIGLGLVTLIKTDKNIVPNQTNYEIDCNKEYYVMTALAIVALIGALFIYLALQFTDNIATQRTPSETIRLLPGSMLTDEYQSVQDTYQYNYLLTSLPSHPFEDFIFH